MPAWSQQASSVSLEPETMSINDNSRQDSIETRTVRALEEPLTVLTTDHRPIQDQDVGVVSVTSHSGSVYEVNVNDGHCTCPDAEYNLDDDEACKHLRRARIALGRKSVSTDTIACLDVDPQLAANAPGPAVATSDGGVILDDDGNDADQWEGPFAEYDQYGELTGAEYVRCRDCGHEVIVGHEDDTTHAAGCGHE
jgi:predicted nucleic acid-binding Zn finger protein